MIKKDGFSLVEVMIVSGLLGALALLSAHLFKQNTVATKKMEQNFEVNQILTQVGAALLNANACKETFNNVNLSSGNAFIGSVKTNATTTLFSVNQKVGGVEILELKLTASPVIAANQTGTASFEMKLKKLSSGTIANEMTVNKKIGLNVTLDGASKIIGCYSGLDNAIDSARSLACGDLGGTFNASGVPVCALSSLNLSGSLTASGNITTSGSLQGASGSVTGGFSAASFTYTSDKNYKKNIVAIENALLTISELRPVHFHWKSKKDDIQNGKLDSGFIAQEVEDVLPEVVFETNGRKVVDYTRIVPYLVSAIKEQQLEIARLKKQVTRLRIGKQ